MDFRPDDLWEPRVQVDIGLKISIEPFDVPPVVGRALGDSSKDRTLGPPGGHVPASPSMAD